MLIPIGSTLAHPLSGALFADPPPSEPEPNPTYAPSMLDNLPAPPDSLPFTPTYNLLTILCIIAITLIFIPFLIYWCLYGSCCRRHVWRRYSAYRHKRRGKKEIKKEGLRRFEQQQEEERQREREIGLMGRRMRSLSESMRGPWRTRGGRSFTWSAGQDMGRFGPMSGGSCRGNPQHQAQFENGTNGWRSRAFPDVSTQETTKARKWWWQVWFSRHKRQESDNDRDNGFSFDDQAHFPNDYNRRRRSFLGHLFGPPESPTPTSLPNNIPSTDEDVPTSSIRELSPRPIEEDAFIRLSPTTMSRSSTLNSLHEIDLGSDIDESSTIRHSTRKTIPTVFEAIHPQVVSIYAKITKPEPLVFNSKFVPRPYLTSKIANRLRRDPLEEEPTLQSQRLHELQQRAAFRSISAPAGIVFRPPTITRKVQTSQHEDHAISISSGGTTPLDASVPNYSALFAQGLTRRLEYLEEPVVIRQTLGLAMPPMGSTPISGIVVNQDVRDVEKFVEVLRKKLEWWKGQTALTGDRDRDRNAEWAYPSAQIVGEEENGYFVGQVPIQAEHKDRKGSTLNLNSAGILTDTSKENTSKPRTQIYLSKETRSKPHFKSHSRRGTELSFRTALSNVSINEVDGEGTDSDRGRRKGSAGCDRTRGQREREDVNTNYSEVVLKYSEKGRVASERDRV